MAFATRPLSRGAAALLFWLLALPALPAAAEVRPPDRMLAETTGQMVAALRSDRALLRQRPQHLFELVDRVLAPHVDFERMSHWVLGKNWRSATPEQRARFVTAFRLLMIRFYTSALLEQPDRIDNLLTKADGLITYLPTQISPGSEIATVRSEVHLDNGKVIPVHFSVHRKDGDWKVFDVSVEGISVVTNYRSSFASAIQEAGLDGLITQIEERNRSILAKVTAGNPTP